MAYQTATIDFLFPSRRLKQDVRFVGKCYTPEKSASSGLTLLFFHCAGSHKESWEPTIQSLFTMDGRTIPGRQPLIREAWSFDMPSHGEAAVWNRELMERIDGPISVEDYGEGLRHFVASRALNRRRLVAIGHSLGATAMLLATLPDPDLPPVAYETVVMVESAVIEPTFNKEHFEAGGLLQALAKATLKRRDTWDSREQAKEYFQSRMPWNTWDSRVLDVYVRHALRPVEPQGGDGSATGFALCCPNNQESPTYIDSAPHFRVVDDFFRPGLYPSLPVHWVTGGRPDIAPEYVHESVMRLREVASFQRVPDAGHFVVQQNPDGLAVALYRILSGNFAAKVPRPKL